MDRTGRVSILLSPREAQLLAENLPAEKLQEEGWDVDSLEKRLLNGVGGNDAPRDLAGIEKGYSSGGQNERTGVWGDSESATPSDYVHGYARGMV
jgi:hypothetical protein